MQRAGSERRDASGRSPRGSEVAFRPDAAAAFERARRLENDGKHGEAEDEVRPFAVRAAVRLPATLAGLGCAALARGDDDPRYRILEFRPFRRALLEALGRRPAGRRRVAAALRRAIRANPRCNGARTLLADVLRLHGATEEVERLVRDAYAVDLPGAATSRFDLAITLALGGRYGSALERAVLRHLREADGSERLTREWPQLFSALMCGRRYLPAFRLGEAALDRHGRIDDPQPLMWPWWRIIPRAVNERRFLADELRRISSARRTGKLRHWFVYYRALLLGWMGDYDAARSEYRGLTGLQPVRYAWMRQAAVVAELEALQFRRAIAVCRDVLRHNPRHWWVRCRMAEAQLGLGDVSGAWRALARARETAAPAARREVLTWHGEILLWLGLYRRALRLLDEAVRLGATTFVHGWRGAARLKLGDPAGALRDLDRAIELDAKDIEAFVWRGETLRLLGRREEALRDLEHFIVHHPACAWGYLNRGLLCAEGGDEAGMRADFDRLPEDVRRLLLRRFRVRDGRSASAEQIRRMLQAGLDLARGVRRWESYVNHIWMARARLD